MKKVLLYLAMVTLFPETLLAEFPIGWKRLEINSGKNKLTLRYPPEFKKKSLRGDNGKYLESPYWIISGGSGEKYYFGISFEIVKVSILAVMKAKNEPCFKENFPRGNIDSFRETDPYCFKKSGHTDFVRQLGTEGEYQETGFLALSEEKTLIARWSTFATYNDEKHQISHENQENLIYKIINTMEYR